MPLWFAVVGFSMQYFLNMEIERYTLATGEAAPSSPTPRYWKPWGLIFCAWRRLTQRLPGVGRQAGATLFMFLFGFGDIVKFIASIVLQIAIGAGADPVAGGLPGTREDPAQYGAG